MFRVTQRKQGGDELTNQVVNERAALVLAEMMRRAGDPYSTESAVRVCDARGRQVALWRGGVRGWQPSIW